MTDRGEGWWGWVHDRRWFRVPYYRDLMLRAHHPYDCDRGEEETIWNDSTIYDNSTAARRHPPRRFNEDCVHDVPLPWSTTGQTVPIACGGVMTHEQLLAEQGRSLKEENG